MKELKIEEFIEIYRPVCNSCTPYPNGKLKDALGDVIWDKRDYKRIATNIGSRNIWTIEKIESDDTKESYRIFPGIIQNMSNKLVGYIVTYTSYNSNNISNLEVII